MTAPVFDRIYRSNAWHGVESRSGPGSGSASTCRVAGAIVQLVAELGVASVLDAACGDGFWMPDLPGYVGVDVSREAIRLARARRPDREYIVGDVATIALPRRELVFTRDAMQHLSLHDAATALASIRATMPRWLLASTYVGGRNIDVPTGSYFEPDLTAEPFGLGKPERMIFDGWSWEEPVTVRDPRKHLGLWRLDDRA